MDRLTEEEVLHVAKLARLEIQEKKMKKFQVELKQLLNNVEKIKEVDDNDAPILISPTTEAAREVKDASDQMVTFEEIKANIPDVKGNFIESPVMVHEE